MAKLRGKVSEFHVEVNGAPWTVQPMPGGLWSLLTIIIVGGQAQFEVEGTCDSVYKAVKENLDLTKPDLAKPFIA